MTPTRGNVASCNGFSLGQHWHRSRIFSHHLHFCHEYYPHTFDIGKSGDLVAMNSELDIIFVFVIRSKQC